MNLLDERGVMVSTVLHALSNRLMLLYFFLLVFLFGVGFIYNVR